MFDSAQMRRFEYLWGHFSCYSHCFHRFKIRKSERIAQRERTPSPVEKPRYISKPYSVIEVCEYFINISRGLKYNNSTIISNDDKYYVFYFSQAC